MVKMYDMVKIFKMVHMVDMEAMVDLVNIVNMVNIFNQVNMRNTVNIIINLVNMAKFLRSVITAKCSKISCSNLHLLCLLLHQC